MNTKDEREVEEMMRFAEGYAGRSGITVEKLFQWKSIVPARLDRCDDPDCGGWHAIPRNFYTQRDVDEGFVQAEILHWQEMKP